MAPTVSLETSACVNRVLTYICIINYYVQGYHNSFVRFFRSSLQPLLYINHGEQPRSQGTQTLSLYNREWNLSNVLITGGVYGLRQVLLNCRWELHQYYNCSPYQIYSVVTSTTVDWFRFWTRYHWTAVC